MSVVTTTDRVSERNGQVELERVTPAEHSFRIPEAALEGAGLDLEFLSITVANTDDPDAAAEKVRRFIDWLRSLPETPALAIPE